MAPRRSLFARVAAVALLTTLPGCSRLVSFECFEEGECDASTSEGSSTATATAVSSTAAQGGGGSGSVSSSSGTGGTGGQLPVDPCDSMVCIDVYDSHFEDTRSTATEGTTNWSFYSCDMVNDESGPEIVYRVHLPSPSTLTAVLDWTAMDSNTDIDLYLLTEANSGSCSFRDDIAIPPWQVAGIAYVVADTFVDPMVGVKPGSYKITIDFTPL